MILPLAALDVGHSATERNNPWHSQTGRFSVIAVIVLAFLALSYVQSTTIPGEVPVFDGELLSAPGNVNGSGSGRISPVTLKGRTCLISSGRFTTQHASNSMLSPVDYEKGHKKTNNEAIRKLGAICTSTGPEATSFELIL